MTETDDIVARLHAAERSQQRIGDWTWAPAHGAVARRLFLESASYITRLEERCVALTGQVEAGAAEVERLRGLFRLDGDQHATHIKALTEAHEARISKYAEAVTEHQYRADALQAEVERLRAALKPFSCSCVDKCLDYEWLPSGAKMCASANARAALQRQEPKP